MQRDCNHNPGVICNNGRCSVSCGWNPREVRRRKNMIEGQRIKSNIKKPRKLIIKGGKRRAD